MGTMAIYLGKTFDIDPFGNLHFNMQHLLVGVECALPLIVMNTILFTMDRPFRSSKHVSIEEVDGKLTVKTPKDA